MTNRGKLFKMHTEKKISLNTLGEICKPMRGLPDEEKERIAKEAIEKIEAGKNPLE